MHGKIGLKALFKNKQINKIGVKHPVKTLALSRFVNIKWFEERLSRNWDSTCNTWNSYSREAQ